MNMVRIARKGGSVAFVTALTLLGGLVLPVSASALDSYNTDEVSVTSMYSKPSYKIIDLGRGRFGLRLIGAKAEVRGMDLTIVDDSTSEVLEFLPETSLIDNVELRVQYDISDPRNVIFYYTRPGRNRGFLKDCYEKITREYNAGMSLGRKNGRVLGFHLGAPVGSFLASQAVGLITRSSVAAGVAGFAGGVIGGYAGPSVGEVIGGSIGALGGIREGLVRCFHD